MEKFFGNYRGIVLSNSDPEERNRVKIFVPQVSLPLVKQVNSLKEDLYLRSLGDNTIDNFPSELLEQIEPLLPWAEYAAPLFGGGSATYYNPTTKQATNTSGTAADTKNTSPVKTDAPTSSSEYHISGDISVTDKPVSKEIERRNLEIFVTAIGYSESGWNTGEAYSNLDNKTVTLYNSKGRRTQIANSNINDGIKRGLSPSAAYDLYADLGFLRTNSNDAASVKSKFQGDPRSLNGVGLDKTSKLAQLNAGIEYLRSYNPKAYTLAAQGNFRAAIKATSNSKGQYKWYGLRDKANEKTFNQIIEPKTKEDFAVQQSWLNKAKDSTEISLATAKAEGTAYDSGRGAKASSTVAKDTKTQGTENPITAIFDMFKSANPLADRNVSTPLDGLPGGIFSTPTPGAHVWVFFEGGDPMYPVYFAQHIVTEDWVGVKQRSSGGSKGPVSTETDRVLTTSMVQPGAGAIELLTQVRHDSVEGDIEESGFKISTQGGGTLEMMSTGTVDYAPVRRSRTTDGDEFHSVFGDNSEYVAGENNLTIGEDFTLEIGKWDSDSVSAAQAIYEAIEPVHNKRKNTIVPTGTAPCPNCNRTILSTKGDGIINTVLRTLNKALNKMLPRTGAVPGFAKEILSVALKPIKIGKQKKFMTSTSCGTCTNHRVPTYTGGPQATATDEEYVANLSSIQDKVLDLEKKTGFGGDYKVKVARNASLVVGLAPNNLEPYREIPGTQVLAGSEIYEKEGAMGFKTENIKQYEPLEMNGPDLGNYDMFIGNKLHIRTGSGGIFTETRGQLNMHGGSIEMTGNSIVVGNNNGITKINGAAVQMYGQSIQLGEAATNVHVVGSMHCAANLNTMGGVYAQGGVSTPSLNTSYDVEKTSTSSSPDYTGETARWLTTGGPALKAMSASLKSVLHYSSPGQIGYLATAQGIDDLVTEYMSLIMSVVPIDGFTGIGVCAVGPVTVFNFPHVHPASTHAHYHSYERPRGDKFSGSDSLATSAQDNTATIPKIC